jgi:hypothetical protein
MFVVIVLMLAGCSHPTGLLLQMDTPYSLRTINGQLLPYAVNGTSSGPTVTEGTITFTADHQALRHERRVTGSAVTTWNQPATFYTQLGRLVITYQGWPTAQGGPMRASDTLTATKTGGYVLHEGGLTLLFCPGGSNC